MAVLLVCSVVLLALLATLLAGALVRHRTSRTWRRRHDPIPRPGWEQCPTCRGTGEFHHEPVTAIAANPETDPCPICHGVGQLRVTPYPVPRS